MKWVLISSAIVYGFGFVLVLMVNLPGPATPGLALYRAAGWPLLPFGFGKGVPQVMDGCSDNNDKECG